MDVHTAVIHRAPVTDVAHLSNAELSSLEAGEDGRRPPSLSSASSFSSEPRCSLAK
jgi:hypothetical protein